MKLVKRTIRILKHISNVMAELDITEADLLLENLGKAKALSKEVEIIVNEIKEQKDTMPLPELQSKADLVTAKTDEIDRLLSINQNAQIRRKQ